MPWTVKDGIPEYVSWLESARVAILGSDYEWVGEYFWLLSERTLSTADFCALGPVVCEPLIPGDFLGLIGAGRVGGGVQAATLGAKLQCFLQQKMFEAYCIQEAQEGLVCTFLYSQTTGVESGGNRVIFNRMVPPCDFLAVRRVSGSGTPGHIVYWTYADGSTDYHIASGGAFQTDSDGVQRWTYPWNTGAPLWISMNADGEEPQLWEFSYCTTGSVETGYVAPELERPPYALPPPSQTYDSVADLGKELDNLERKLHVVIEQGITTEIDRAWPLAIDGDVLPIESDEDVELVDIAGVIVTLTNIDNQVDMHFGEPRQLHRVGRIVFGTAAGWLAPIEITVTPQLFVGLPPGVNRVRLHLLPPTTGSMQMVKRAAPAG